MTTSTKAIEMMAQDPQQISIDVLLEKYAKGSETSVEQIYQRVASALAQAELPELRDHWTSEFLAALRGGFVPAGRIQSAAGTGIQATLINCFVQPVGDSVSDDVDGSPSIYKALAQAAETMRRGGGVGYDFSSIRPRGALVKGTFSNASGPVSYMRVFDRSCETVESAGSRRGAQMGILRCDHPDILEFIASKDTGDLKNFNISVAVTDKLMFAAESNLPFDLVHKAKPSQAQIDAGGHRQASDGNWVYRTVSARELKDRIIRSTYDHADPGVVFIDRINAENNLWYVEVLEATNPCAEQPLPKYGCCCIGSIDLTKYVVDPFGQAPDFEWHRMRQVAQTAVRMLDNVLDVTFWPLPEQRAEAMAKRRIGLGFLGLGSALAMLGIRYNSPEGLLFAARVAQELRDQAYLASTDLAGEKGAFPLLDAGQYLESGFAKRLPDHIRRRIVEGGIRNSHLLSIAPTGTITLAFADNASNGIEPPFAWSYSRKKRMPDGTLSSYLVEDHAYRLYRVMGNNTAHLPTAFVSALEMSATDHLQMVAAVAPFVDSAISKTVNVPKDYPFKDFEDLYDQAWRAGLKGLATYRPNDVTGSVLDVHEAHKAEEHVKDIDPLTTRIDHRPDGDLQGVTSKVAYWTHEGAKVVYLTVNFARVNGVLNGLLVSIERPVEFFVPAGQRDEGQQWISATMRLLSMVARSGSSIAKALSTMREVVWDKGPVRYGLVAKEGGTHAPRFHDSEVAAIGYALQQLLSKRGFLDGLGNQVPLTKLVLPAPAHLSSPDAVPMLQTSIQTLPPGGGKKCPECGAHALHKVDGCQRCSNCNYIGACG